MPLMQRIITGKQILHLRIVIVLLYSSKCLFYFNFRLFTTILHTVLGVAFLGYKMHKWRKDQKEKEWQRVCELVEQIIGKYFNSPVLYLVKKNMLTLSLTMSNRWIIFSHECSVSKVTYPVTLVSVSLIAWLFESLFENMRDSVLLLLFKV